ncbi:hypothetical protein R16034_02408 [Ralstonia edaphis]|uniref:Uncharacterized protein n=1 Tax=Ralstonia edaphi TaxID=3058599 RepID=A0AB72X8A1_9RALS|nr:hypothetical protein R16034_02408 [Ralstonia sp. LMG 6871]
MQVSRGGRVPAPRSSGQTMSNPEKSPTPEQRAANRRLGLILGTIALVFFLGVIFKRVVFGG